MKNPKVGERCRIYVNGECTKPIDGTVVKFSAKSDWLYMERDDGAQHSAHRTHFVRLKPKPKPREIYINEYRVNGVARLNDAYHCTETSARSTGIPSPTHIRTIKFREVL